MVQPQDKKQSKEMQALYLLDTVLAQWTLLQRDDCIVTLCVKKDGTWGIVEARRMTFTDSDLAILNTIGKADEGKMLSVTDPVDYFG